MAISLYYVVVTSGSTAPTAAQVVAGVNYAAVTVLKAGSVAYLPAGVYDDNASPVTGRTQNTGHDQYWAAYDGTTYSNVAAGTITTQQASTGGSSSAVTISAVGVGTAVEAASGGSSSSVSLSAAGAGVAAYSGGSSSPVSVSAVGAGTGPGVIQMGVAVSLADGNLSIFAPSGPPQTPGTIGMSPIGVLFSLTDGSVCVLPPGPNPSTAATVVGMTSIGVAFNLADGGIRVFAPSL